MKSQHESMPGPVKLMAAVMGTSAVVAMGAVTVAVSDGSAMLMSSETSLGETTTETTAPSTLETPFATPPITSTEEAG
ncbi:hypothetical protein BH09ACT7_BH09ACT7_36720 [soil metagenome]